MECDSAHSKIEKKSKPTAVYTPEGWAQVMRMARTNPSPFNVTKLMHDDFINFNPGQLQFVIENEDQHRKRGKAPQAEQKGIEESRRFKFHDFVWFQYRKSEQNYIYVKLDYKEKEFFRLPRKNRKGRRNNIPFRPYQQRLGISVQKKRDLLHLCAQNLIPRAYHEYYELLPTAESERDRLPEPDCQEPEDENFHET